MTRAEINRLNAQKSTGPRTPEGQQTSSLNALRHGLTSQFAVIPGEDHELYQIHIQAFLDEYDPQSVSELHLARSLADLAWRIDRVASMEANLLRLPADQEEILDTVTLVKTRDVLMRALSNLSLHGHRLSRQFAKTRTELLEIQKENKQETAPGFVFTDPIADVIDETEPLNRDRDGAIPSGSPMLFDVLHDTINASNKNTCGSPTPAVHFDPVQPARQILEPARPSLSPSSPA